MVAAQGGATMVEFTFPSGVNGWVYGIRGTVTDAKRWTETHVRSSGGGGRIDPKHGGTVSAPTISSTILEKGELWIRGPRGKEVQINMVLPMTTGHDVSILWGNRDGADSGINLYWLNSSSQRHALFGGIDDSFLLTKEENAIATRIFVKWAAISFGVAFLLLLLYRGSLLSILAGSFGNMVVTALAVCWIVPMMVVRAYKDEPRRRHQEELMASLEQLANRGDLVLEG
jgi:hypothetical protein